ncbi:hypothetical protein [Haloarcula argentinensis]|uniref:Uncharacterized protein n=1 Tax=Haloarcula argentinensis TaxID=43776 RepID=A0A847UQA0_HALAR|nr:hypothetical protein [Haloarcula argentinensis]NLV14411.1 hypothetical protein [Haloarcula argentinensis]
MIEPYYCPAEGCDYGKDEEKSLAAVRSHINAMGESHDWELLKPLLHQQGETSDDQQDEQPEQANDQPDDQPDGSDDDPPGTGGAAATEGGGDDDQQNEGVEQTETPENSQNDQQDMDQSSEYDQQLQQAQQADDQPDDAGESSQSGGQRGDDTSQTTSGRGVPVWAIVGGLTLVALLLFVARSGDDQPEQVPSEVVEDTEQADPVADDPEPEVTWSE